MHQHRIIQMMRHIDQIQTLSTRLAIIPNDAYIPVIIKDASII